MPPLPPSWDGFHPLVVHFPIALLLVAPLFVLIAAALGKRAFMVSALLLMTLGVAGAFVASNTGEAAYSEGEPDEALDEEYVSYDLAEQHGEQAEFARNVFAVAAGLYAVVVVVAFVKPSSRHLKGRLLTHLPILVILMWGNMLLANAAHMGGELVHRYGWRAPVAVAEQETPEDEATEDEAPKDETTEEPADQAPADQAPAEDSPADQSEPTAQVPSP